MSNIAKSLVETIREQVDPDFDPPTLIEYIFGFRWPRWIRKYVAW